MEIQYMILRVDPETYVLMVSVPMGEEPSYGQTGDIEITEQGRRGAVPLEEVDPDEFLLLDKG